MTAAHAHGAAAHEIAMLFTPIKIGQLTLPGRLIKTATSETRASDHGFVTDELLDFYRPNDSNACVLD